MEDFEVTLRITRTPGNVGWAVWVDNMEQMPFGYEFVAFRQGMNTIEKLFAKHMEARKAHEGQEVKFP